MNSSFINRTAHLFSCLLTAAVVLLGGLSSECTSLNEHEIPGWATPAAFLPCLLADNYLNLACQARFK